MKKNHPIVNREIPMKDGSILVSQTDLKGRIISCNRAFIEMSGFSEIELIGASHNIVRHPFMPSILFQDLWATIKAGDPWSGMVKNRNKNGCYYWVLANVTPLYENGTLQGYMSVRTKPTAQEIETAESLYREINASPTPDTYITKSQPLLHRLGLVNLSSRLWLTATTAIATQGLLFIEHLLGAGWPILLATLFIGAAITLLPLRGLIREFASVTNYVGKKLRAISSGDYFDWTEVTHEGELGRLEKSVKMAQIKLGYDVINANETVLRIISLNTELDSVTASFQESANSLDESTANIKKINTTVRNTSINTEDADNLANSASTKAETSGERLKEALVAMESIRNASGEISKIISLIDEISFKTKLLSINASVEAAHAGDQGKGFSVVADEVRSLAAHTANAASEIKQLIVENQERINSGEEKMKNSDNALNDVIDEIKRVSGLLSEISIAGKEQTIGVESLASSLQIINSSVQTSTQLVTKTSAHSRKLGTDAENVMKKSGLSLA